MQSWDEHRENHDALMRLLDREREPPAPYVDGRRWRCLFWYLAVIATLEAGFVFLLLDELAKSTLQ
jgi:hypothetical protein